MAQRRILQLLIASFIALSAFASSHREAPLITEDPTHDNTDVYVFRSPDAPDTITILANYIPLEEPSSGPNFYNFSNSGVYEIHIDNNGDSVEDITYQFQFRTDIRNRNTFLYNVGPVTSLDDPDLNIRQFYTVTRLSGGRGLGGRGTTLGTTFQVAPYNIGPKSTPDYAALANAAIGNLSGNGGRVFAGPRDDPFFVDIGAIVDLLTLRPIQSLHRVPPVAANTDGVDGLRGFNVHTIALQIPISQLVSGGNAPSSPTSANAVIGVWASASSPRVTILNANGTRRTLRGNAQVSRLGMPLVNEVVMSLQFKDLFNMSQPSGDATLFQTNETFRNRILDPELATLMNLLYGLDVPPAPRNDLVQVYLTGIPGANQPPNVKPAEMIRLNVAVPPTAAPNRLGVIGGDLGGFPNGRRLADDVVDISMRVVAGVLIPAFNKAPNNALTDGVDANERAFLSTFPYAALPHQGYESRPHANQ